MNNYDKYKFLKEELKAPRFIDENEEIQWFTTQLYGLYKQSYRLRQENKQLKEKINVYENPEDLTLMFMYCDLKAKDKIKQLKEKYIAIEKERRTFLKHLDNVEQQRDLYKEVIEEVREYIENDMPYLQEVDNEYEDVNGNTYFTYKEYDESKLLQILDKGENNASTNPRS